MARQESDREDLLREATALVERIELAPPASTEADHIVAGFRASGALSLYFGADPAYHFNSAGELRRAYIGGLLYKARDGQLVSLERVRTKSEVQLQSRPVGDDTRHAILTKMQDRLARLAAQIASEELSIVGQVPVDANVRGRLASWLRAHENIPVARRPHAS